MLPVKAWRIFYADGSTFDSTQGKWAEAPPFGVSCVVWYHEHPYKTIDRAADDESIYIWRGEGEDEGYKMGMWRDTEGLYRVFDLATKSSSPLLPKSEITVTPPETSEG